MPYLHLSPGWAQRRLRRHLERRASGRIIRWISIPAGAPEDRAGPETGRVEAMEGAAANVLAFAPRPFPSDGPDRDRA
ncbi:hypothetical protein [Methylobacterium oxalidis]|uniref:hypothetical protein n=1 Tax=Methylobacterium oxalidis TaxID=944322 RepID=UPI001EDF3135|nr:hypothetical protein [Methylobacterium oxalidis]